MSTRAFVFGGEGMLGQALARLLPDLGYEVLGAPGRAACDVTDRSAVEAALERSAPQIVFNASAYTNVDAAEEDGERAWRVNALGPEIIGRAAAERGAILVHVSTDFVFDGEQERPYDEFDEPKPQGVYARSKLAGERLAAGATPRLFIVRVGCLYGRGGRNFPSTIASRLLAGQNVQAEASRSGTPTWVDDVVRTIAPLARGTAFGTYHCTSGGETSWYDYARFLAMELGRPEGQVRPADLKLRAPRPRRAVLDNLMLRLRGLDTMPHWRKAAQAYVKQEHGRAGAP